MKSKLSIIIPVYNGEKYISNIISAFMAQTEKNFELVFVDDGSTDGTFAKLNKYANSTTMDIQVIHQENAGVSAARNKGIEAAKGEYIGFADVDDFVSDDYISVFNDNINSGFDLLIFQSKRVTETQKLITDTSYDGTQKITAINMLNRFIVNPTKFGVYNIFIKKSLLDNENIRFVEGYKYYEDYNFLYRVITLSGKTLITEHQLYFYILRDGSAMQKFTSERIECMQIMTDLQSFFDKHLPEFSKTYKKWGVSRLYWSVMWQACLAMDTREALAFSRRYKVKKYLKNLIFIPSKKVAFSSVLFLISPRAFILAAKIFGKRRTKIRNVHS